MSEILRAILALLAIGGVAHAQTVPGCLNGTPCTAIQTFTPTGTASLSATVTSASVAFPSTGGVLNVMLVNTGSVPAYIAIGNSSVVATTSGIPVLPGQPIVLAQGISTNIAAITASGTTSLSVTSGTGQPAIVYSQLTIPPITASTPPLSYSTSGALSVGTTSGVLITGGTYTKSLLICALQNSTANVWLNVVGGTAVAAQGIELGAGGGCALFGSTALPVPTANITAITDGGSAQTVTVSGG
jgi:hypothetical protein